MNAFLFSLFSVACFELWASFYYVVATMSGWDLSSRNGRVVDCLEPSNMALSGIQHSVFIPCFFFLCVC